MDSGYYVFDCETNALDQGGGRLPTDAKTVWCIVLHDLALNRDWHNDIHTGFDRAKEAFANAKLLVCHNLLDFDLKVLKRLLGFVVPQDCVIVDTLVWSRALYPDRRLYDGKGHGLEGWGERFGVPKPPIEDFSIYTPDHLHRCYEDVKINVKTYEALKEEASMYPSGKFLRLEQEISGIISEQCKRGTQLDIPLCEWLLEQLNAWLKRIDDGLCQHFSTRVIPGAATDKIWVIKGQYRKDILNRFGPQIISAGKTFSFGDATDEDGAVFCKVDFPEINFGSDQQLVQVLSKMGWEPLSFTPKGSPQITDESLATWAIDKPEIREIITRRMVVSRIGYVKGWLRHVDVDGRIRGSVNPQGAVTLRMTHQRVVNVPKYDPDEPLSEYYRQCFISTTNPNISDWEYEHTDPRTGETKTVVVKGKMAMVGCDAKGLENRMLANRMNDAELTKIICDPNNDFHTFMWKTVEEYFNSRGAFKNWEYAFFYGAADLKLGAMASTLDEVTEEEAIAIGWRQVEQGKSKGLWKCGTSKGVPWRGVITTITGQRIRARVMAGLPSLDKLNERVKEVCRQGHLIGMDGRRLIMRVGYDHRVEEHKALNTLLQGDGALVMKVAQVLLHRALEAERIPHWFLQTVHDEYQLECWPQDRFVVAEAERAAIIEAGKILGLRCPLDAEAKIGVNWGQTH